MLFIGFVFGMFFVSACRRNCDQQRKRSRYSTGIEGFNLNGYTKGGTKIWDIKGDKANISDNTVHITNVNANSYADKGSATNSDQDVI